MRLAVIADVHGNLIALETVLADIARRGSDLIVNLGDCVTSPLWPRETFEDYDWSQVAERAIANGREDWAAAFAR